MTALLCAPLCTFGGVGEQEFCSVNDKWLYVPLCTVVTWRNRFLAALTSLKTIEASAPEELEQELRLLLSDKKRSGAPSKFTSEQIMAIIDLACKNPSDLGFEVSQWSLPLLTVEIKKQGIAEQLSPKSVSRFLR